MCGCWRGLSPGLWLVFEGGGGRGATGAQVTCSGAGGGGQFFALSSDFPQLFAIGFEGRQKAATQRNMRREERVTVQGPVKKQPPNGLSHGGGGGGGGEVRNFRPFFRSLASFRNCFVIIPLTCPLVPRVSPVQRCCSLRLREVWCRGRNFPAIFRHWIGRSLPIIPPPPHTATRWHVVRRVHPRCLSANRTCQIREERCACGDVRAPVRIPPPPPPTAPPLRYSRSLPGSPPPTPPPAAKRAPVKIRGSHASSPATPTAPSCTTKRGRLPPRPRGFGEVPTPKTRIRVETWAQSVTADGHVARVITGTGGGGQTAPQCTRPSAPPVPWEVKLGGSGKGPNGQGLPIEIRGMSDVSDPRMTLPDPYCPLGGGGGGQWRLPKIEGRSGKGPNQQDHSSVIMNSGAKGAENFLSIGNGQNFLNKYMANDGFSEPPRRADSKNSIFIFGPGHLRGPGVRHGRICGGPLIAPFLGLGGRRSGQMGCVEPPPKLKARAPQVFSAPPPPRPCQPLRLPRRARPKTTAPATAPSSCGLPQDRTPRRRPPCPTPPPAAPRRPRTRPRGRGAASRPRPRPAPGRGRGWSCSGAGASA